MADHISTTLKISPSDEAICAEVYMNTERRAVDSIAGEYMLFSY